MTVMCVRVCGGPLARVSWSAFPRVDRVNVFGWQSVFRGQPVLIFQKRVARPAAPNTVVYCCCDRHSARLYCRTILYAIHTYDVSRLVLQMTSSFLRRFPNDENGARFNVCTNNAYTYSICCTFNWNLCLINNTLGPAPNDNNKARRALQQKYIVKQETPADGANCARVDFDWRPCNIRTGRFVTIGGSRRIVYIIFIYIYL